MRKLIVQFVRNEEGQDLVEYALLGGIITAVGAALITTIAGKVSTMMTNLDTAITP